MGPFFFNTTKMFRQGGDGLTRRVVLCLGLLNAVLLIVAVVLGNKCAKVKEGSLHISHSAVTQLFGELDYLRSNHSDVIEAEEEAKKALESAIKNHGEVKVKIEQLKTVNDDYRKQLEALRTVKTNLQSNISALEGSCGRCLPGWIHFNSSCYFFSYTESTTLLKTWHDSRADCVRRGSDLAVIDDQQEQTFVVNTITNVKISSYVWYSGFWIGMTDSETEGKWVWINNVTEVESRYWNDGEPNNLNNEHCGAVHPSGNIFKAWNDVGCNSEIKWICEKAVTSMS